MKQLITIFFTLLALSAWSQAIEGGGGICHVSGDPNDVVALEVQDVRAECFAVVDTTSGQLYIYDPTGTIGSRWVQFVSSSGNGIITALPLNTVSIAASANDFQIEDMRMLQLQSRSMIVGAMGASQYDTATTFGRIYEPGFNTPTTAFFDGMKAGRLHAGIDPWGFEYKVGTWGGFNAGDYAYSGFRWDIDSSVYRIRIYKDGNSPDAFPGLEYDADFSADFVDRSLVDKAYVDGVVGGGGDPILIDDETLHTTTQTALAGEVVLIDCSAGAVTVNPPASPVKNMKFYVSDAAKSAGTNTITIDFTTASQPLCGGVENYLIENDGGFAGFVYVNGTTGWIPLNR